MADLSMDYLVLMNEVVDFTVLHVQDGGIPFAAFVVDADGRVLGRGVNRVCAQHDPTAHAEVEAIRNACRDHRVSSLHGATLLASGEPCAMCYVSALYAGVSQVLYAVDRDEAAAYGFDYRNTYRIFKHDPRYWPSLKVEKHVVTHGLDPFRVFHKMPL